MKVPTDIVIKRVLNQKATEQEAVQVAAWLATEQGQAWLSEDMERNAQDITEGRTPLLDGIPSEDLLRRIDRIIDRTRRRRLLFRVAAVLIPCALIVAVWANLNSRLGGMLFSAPATEQVAALRGERKEIIFQDGSKVYLNAGTQISYPQHFGLSERRVVLNGEAYFEVTPNARRPFVVEAGDASVKVLGTSFNVKAYEAEQTLDVVLLSGSVEFSFGDYRYTMLPSQKLVLDKSRGQVHIYEQENASRAALWRDDVISFRDTPLSEVIATLERWYDVTFEVLNDGAYRSTFTLQTNLLPLSELLREMENISTVQFEEQGDVVRVLVKK